MHFPGILQVTLNKVGAIEFDQLDTFIENGKLQGEFEDILLSINFQKSKTHPF